MKYFFENNKIVVKGKEDFNIEHILECGQVFSYFKKDDKYVVLSADQKAVVVETEIGFEILTNDMLYFENYFDLKTDYSKIKKELSKEKIMQNAIEFGYGIRILKQNLFETLISFIVSANNNIKRIKMILNRIREKFGTNMGDYFAFPTREQLLKATEKDFADLGAGYRAKYLFEVVRQIDDKTLESWKNLNTIDLRKNLMSLMGVGPKVADCILLFGFGKQDVFPVDTWIHQMYEKYFEKCDNRELIRRKLVENFGCLSGYAQQYLFFSMREF